ncbi:MAG: LamG-like jellyroll fold domain-containing protein [Treponema sp.]|nr:LamG-like jellyroll fold domain-containing protein [Treponema sp.]
MKKNKFILGVVACAFAALAMTGCSLTLGNSDDRVVTSGYKLTSISLDTKKVTKDFIKGAKFSYEGLVVNGTYADNSTKVIKDYSVSTPDMYKCEEQTVTVTAADNATATYKITVSLPVKSIAINAESYVVTATYEDNSTAKVNAEWSYSDSNLVATYLGKTAKVAVPKNEKIKTAYDAGVSVKALYDAGVSVGELADATAKDGNTLALSSSMADYLIVKDGILCVDVNKAQVSGAANSHFQGSGPNISWNNPVYGKTNLTGVTVTVKMRANAESANNYDAVLTFTKSTTAAWDFFTICERGGCHINSSKGYSDIDKDYSISDDVWTRVTYVFETNSVKLYFDNQLKTTISNKEHLYDLLNNMDKIGVGIGHNAVGDPDPLWVAGYVDEGTYFADLEIYENALSAEEVAALK